MKNVKVPDKKTTRNAIIIITLAIFVPFFVVVYLTACDDGAVGPGEGGPFPSHTANAELSLPSGSPVKLGECKISSFADEKPVSDDGKASLSLVSGENYQFVFVTGADGVPYLMAYVPKGATRFNVNATTTADALVMFSPYMIGASEADCAKVLNAARGHGDYGRLVSRLENLLKNDPRNVLNSNTHPEVFTLAGSILESVLGSGGNGYDTRGNTYQKNAPWTRSDAKRTGQFQYDIPKKRAGAGSTYDAGKNGPWLEDGPGNKINFVNPKMIHYGANIDNTNGPYDDVTWIKRKPGLFIWKWGWPPQWPESIYRTEYLLNDGSYRIDCNKGDWKNWNLNSSQGKATVTNAGQGVIEIVSFLSGFDLKGINPQTLARVVNAANASKLITDVALGVAEHDAAKIIKAFAGWMDYGDVKELLRRWLWGEGAKGAALWLQTAGKILKQVLNVIGRIENVVFFYDLILASDTHYNVTSQGGVLNFGNNPPVKPYDPNPRNGATGVSITKDLEWKCYDPDGDQLKYDVYFGTTSPPPLGRQNVTIAYYDPGTLKYGTKYYWKVVAKDGKGGVTSGGIWDFTTLSKENKPPNPPSNPNPKNGATNVPTITLLSWDCSDPEKDPLTYDIYFGTSANPARVKTGHTAKTYDPGTLEYKTKYYWKIVAKDDHNNSTTGPVWYFITKEAGSEKDVLHVGMDKGWVTELRNANFNVTTATSIPPDMSQYELVVVNDAGSPSTAGYMKTYISNGGGAIIIAPYKFVGGSGSGHSDLTPIADWYGAKDHNIYYGSFTVRTVINYPFGSNVPSGTTLVWFSYAQGAGYVSNLNQGVTRVATVNYNDNMVYVHYLNYGSGRVVSFLQGFSSSRFPYSPPQGEMKKEADEVFIAGAKWAAR